MAVTESIQVGRNRSIISVREDRLVLSVQAAQLECGVSDGGNGAGKGAEKRSVLRYGVGRESHDGSTEQTVQGELRSIIHIATSSGSMKRFHRFPL